MTTVHNFYNPNDLFTKHFKETDPELFGIVKDEGQRIRSVINLIASENLADLATMESLGGVFGQILNQNYSEGYSNSAGLSDEAQARLGSLNGKRYYSGMENIDKLEDICNKRFQKLFGCDYVNLQSPSGSHVNQVAIAACANPGDVVMGLRIDQGGHLSYCQKVSQGSKIYKAVHYGLTEDGSEIDYDEVERLALEHQPKLIIAGYSAFVGEIDYKRFREITDKVPGCRLMVDMAHYVGFVVAGLIENPLKYCDVCTMTTHKIFSSVRGGAILSNCGDKEFYKKLNFTLFPANAGGSMVNSICAKGVTAGEILNNFDAFKEVMQNVLDNAQTLANTLKSQGINLVGNGTKNHLLLLDLRNLGITGAEAEHRLEEFGICCNKNGIPNDPLPPLKTSGIRLGLVCYTRLGGTTKQVEELGKLIAKILKGKITLEKGQKIVKRLCKVYPKAYGVIK